ncbi:chemotaxis protein CheC [Acetivibrio thermocellus AD2]|jgi:chemotaxis protein CheC|nr:CheC, phosphatase, inhibitor of MCP methylation [Acetivibrio thermocellus AD2]ANV76489.1 CheC, phosphatase, inhibitor of MCP methylation [Acetivibrio thermocellus DSM 2360]EIC05245.1 CheC domain protein [Acetivibrio thermocellus YS]CDG35206.1 CheC, inhibitor of MCP methylation [Acetivibrio thermocellus BC1]SOD24686.1 chemotaxis protein CheC [Acetivibrio thermocellus]
MKKTNKGIRKMSVNFDNLDNIQIDVLREIGNIGSGNAATALAKMLNKRVNMDVPQVKVLQFQEVSDILGGAEIPVVGLLLRVTGDISGSIMFILEKKAAGVLVNILMGKPLDEIVVFDEIAISALKEVGNILAGSYLSALSTLTNLNILPSVPELAIDMAGAIISVPAIEFGKLGDSVLFIETEFSEGSTKVVGNFFLVPDIDSYEVLLKALGVAN